MTKRKPKEIKISEVLHLAADKYLARDMNDGRWIGPYQHTCTAIKKALGVKLPETQKEFFSDHWGIIRQGLINLGLSDTSGVEAFKEFENFYDPTPESQGARYMWLKFCALLAEEQGV